MSDPVYEERRRDQAELIPALQKHWKWITCALIALGLWVLWD